MNRLNNALAATEVAKIKGYEAGDWPTIAAESLATLTSMADFYASQQSQLLDAASLEDDDEIGTTIEGVASIAGARAAVSKALASFYANHQTQIPTDDELEALSGVIAAAGGGVDSDSGCDPSTEDESRLVNCLSDTEGDVPIAIANFRDRGHEPEYDDCCVSDVLRAMGITNDDD